MKPTVPSDRKRAVVTEAENPTYHRKGWHDPGEGPTESYCRHCRQRVSYLVWRNADWLCVVCAEAR